MPVLAYVSRDDAGQPWQPDNSHETTSVIELLKLAWTQLHHTESTYAFMANVRHPSADLVVVSQRGLGIVELKHNYGKLMREPDGHWKVGPVVMKAGAVELGRRNPHDQVQDYATRIRIRLLPPLKTFWSAHERERWEQFRIHTAVCFTHPTGIDVLSAADLERATYPACAPWEHFRILTPADIPAWVVSLSFEVHRGQERAYTPYTLQAEQVQHLVTQVLGGVPWKDVTGLMPSGEPYGYLALMEQGAPTLMMSLDREQHIIGRQPGTGTITIPERFARTSRVHARITRTAEGVFLEDLGSAQGTYVDGFRIRARFRLSEGRQITLGGAAANEKVCQLRFTTTPSSVITVASTELDRR